MSKAQEERRNYQFGDVVICGKTGTAQNPHGKDHSLFVAFAPRENPKIAIAVMVENAGSECNLGSSGCQFNDGTISHR